MKNILDTIGNTPIIELSNIVKHFNLQGNIYAKLEFYNPGLSKKDRIAKYCIEQAKKNGELKDGQEVVEVTSGNTGIGLAIVCNIYQHKFTAILSSAVSKERIQLLKKLGAKVIVVGNEQYGRFSGCNFEQLMEIGEIYCKQNDAYFVKQFSNKYNVEAQQLFAKEAEDYFKKNGVNITHFCNFVGTGGTIMGVQKYYESIKKPIKIILIEPENANAFTKKENINGEHIIQGGGYGKYDLDLIEKEKIDEIMTISDENVKLYMDIMIKKESVLGSYSSAANIWAAVETLKKEPNSNVLIAICDTYLKYLSNDIEW